MLIRYALDVDEQCETRADYALRLLLEGIGVAATRVPDPSGADLVYAPQKPPRLAESTLWIRATATADWDGSRARVEWSREMPVVRAAHERAPAAGESEHVGDDIVYSAYATVGGLLERESRKDALGRPVGRQNDPDVARPVIALYCSRLVSMLERRRRAELDRVPLWPSPKRYAIVLSHDVDRPFAHAPWRFYGRRLVKDVSQREAKAAARGLLHTAKMARVAIATRGTRKSDARLAFEAWMDVERSLGAASCFYVAVTTSADRMGSPYDVTYDFRDDHLVAPLRRAAESGWEIGLHASINAQRIPGQLRHERELLEGVLGGVRVQGVRHHHWALDPELPERTLWEHVEAGLSYDSSLGLNDAAGFRRGMAWPFEPFDRERGTEVPILEIGPTLMDGSIFYRRPGLERGRRLIREHLDLARELGTAAVLDWHAEHL